MTGGWVRQDAAVPCAALFAALLLAVLPSAAPAAVRVTPEQVVVTGDGASATIERSPLRIAIADASGAVVLRQVANARAAPIPVPPSPTDPQPGGSDYGDRPVLYAPLTFTVGARGFVQYPTTSWNANMLANLEGGVQHSARDVESVTAEGEGARLVVGTSDPARKIELRVAPGSPGTMRVAARATPGDGVSSFSDAFATREGEPFRGFGGRHNRIDQRGTSFFNWVQQQNTGAGQLQPAVGDPEYLFPNGPHAAYYVQSQFVSDRYGFLLDRPELQEWRMASDGADRWRVSAAANGIDYVVAPGAPRRTMATLSAQTGRHRVPPAWAVGPQLDRAVRYPNDDPRGYEAQVRDDIAQIAKYRLPLDAYRIEGFEFLSRDTLREIIGKLKGMGIRAILYYRAFVGKDTIGTDSPADYDEAVAKGYVAKTPTGEPYVFISNFNAPAALIDFTNPEAVTWWEGRIREALELGADGFMQDFGEQVQADMVFANGETGATMHNAYPTLYHRATRQFLDRIGSDAFFYTRAGYTGSAAWESANFPGDETTDWSRSAGLASQTTNMLNRGIGGAFGYMTDIGGYFDIGPYEPTTKELLLRWAAWAALSPLYRLHGSVGDGTHVPWNYDEETVQVYSAFSRLHLAARPLILRLWKEAVATGVPIARPLWLEFPGDDRAARQDQEWMLGPDVLVAPVVQQGADGREVYFPRGCWEAPETGARLSGPSTVRVRAGIDELPYFFRCGRRPFSAEGGAAILPRSRSCRSRRAFRIRLSRRLVSARIYVSGKRVRMLRGRRLRARVDLRGLPKRHVRVVVRGRTRSGRTLVERRAYRTCVRRRSSGRSA